MKPQYELVIIGGGAAGLAAAQYGARANLSTLVIEEMAPGGQALLIDQLENYPGILEPVAGFDLAEIMKTQAERFGAEFITASVEKMEKGKNFFQVSTSEGLVKAEAVILATGAKHRHLGIPGEEAFSGRGVSYCATCDGPFFKDKKILVVGGGDAACDEAMYLAKLSDKIVMIHRRDRFRAQKALAERVLANSSIDVRFNTVALEIKGGQKVESVVLKNLESGKSEEEAFDAVFVFIGSDPNVSLVPDAAKDESNSIVTDDRMATNIPGLFAAGDVRVSPFRQIVTACSDGAVAAHAASQYIDEIRGAAYR
ncbi:MAG: thioredoxin-disulfide reductase [Spirochaetia bacterium]|jgi:thioredoxin reductase (NADPH)|nr:thioredoxin-disulfide reductase [Spirochaetales bacterium]MDX9783804.1 thioredoxin-disulfide reductase [Spirochaetia bacterium]